MFLQFFFHQYAKLPYIIFFKIKMASDATKSHIIQQLFSIKILTKLSYWLYIFLAENQKI